MTDASSPTPTSSAVPEPVPTAAGQADSPAVVGETDVELVAVTNGTAPELPVNDGQAVTEGQPEAAANESQPEAAANEAQPELADEAAPAAPLSAAPVVPSPAALAGRLQAAPHRASAAFGRVAEDGTVFVRTPDGEREVGAYPGASPAEALSYFARKFDEVDAQLDLLLHRVTQTDLTAKEAGDALSKLREAVSSLRAVGDLVAMAAKVETIATAVDVRRTVENAERAAAREVARGRREEIVGEAEAIAAQPEERVQWKTSSNRMRELLEEWKTAQRQGPKLERDAEQALWQRLSAARNSFDKLRRVHFAQLGSAQAEAKATKQELVTEAETLATSTDWGPTATSFKRLMDRWRQAGRASRGDDDALWQRFKAAQDAFFAAKDAVVAAESEEFRGNLTVKEALLVQAQALLPIKDLESTKSALRSIQEKWDAAGKVPRADLERIEKGMRRVEAAVREAEDKRWSSTNPEVAARAQSLVTQLEAAVKGLEEDLKKAQASGNAKKVAAAQEALEARQAWLAQARTGLAEFRR